MKAEDRFNQLMDWANDTVAGQQAVLLVGPVDRYAFKDIEKSLGSFPEMLDVFFVGQWARGTAIVVDGKLFEAPEKSDG